MPDSLSASEYILDNFKPSDRVAMLLRNRTTEEVIQRIASAEKIAAPDIQQWLKERNRAGYDIYIGMNTLKEGACSRTKRDIHQIRHVYLDLDYRGPEALKAIQNSDDVPKPNFVLDTSPGKHQVVWKVEGATPQEAEDLQQRMAHEFGADIAATDASRVLRLPGFANRKNHDGTPGPSDETLRQDVQRSRFQGSIRPSKGRPNTGAKATTLRRYPRDAHPIRTRLGLRETRARARRRSRRDHPTHRRLPSGREARSRILCQADSNECPDCPPFLKGRSLREQNVSRFFRATGPFERFSSP